MPTYGPGQWDLIYEASTAECQRWNFDTPYSTRNPGQQKNTNVLKRPCFTLKRTEYVDLYCSILFIEIIIKSVAPPMMEDVLSSPQQKVISGVVNSRLIRPPGSIEGYDLCFLVLNHLIIYFPPFSYEYVVRE